MKKLTTLLLFLCAVAANAQTTIYMQTFNSTYTDWSFNTSDLGGTTSLADNQWAVNNIYTGYTSGLCGTTVPTTAAEPAGITGFPNSNYLHIFSEEGVALCMGTANCNFDAAGTSTYFAAMNTPVVTTGYTGVTFSFWWLCQGDAGAHGKVYYRTSSGGAWTAIPGGPATYYGSSSWALQSVTNSAFDGQAFLEFGFQFTEDLSGSDPAFAVDDIKVTGTPSGATAAFTSSDSVVCQGSCITFTPTSGAGVTSYSWSSTSGYTSTSSSATPVTICFSVAGTYTVTLTDIGTGTISSVTHPVTVNPLPAAITGTHSICVGFTTPLADATPGGTWSSSTPSIATIGSLSGIVTGVSAGTTTISYTLGTGCTATYTFTVYPLPCTAGLFPIIDHTADLTEVRILPNPASNMFTLSAYPETYQSFKVANQLGQALINGNIRSRSTDVDISQLPPGLYCIILNGSNGYTVKKFVKQ